IGIVALFALVGWVVIYYGVPQFISRALLKQPEHDAKLYLQCDWTPMPKNLPASGEIFVLESLSPDPIGVDVSGGLSKQFGPPNNPLIWSPLEKKIGDYGQKCQLFDYGTGPLFDVRL